MPRSPTSESLSETLAAKRAEIAEALRAATRSDPAGSGDGDIAARVEALIADRGAPPEDERLRRCLAEYRDLADTRLAEQGEVFAPQDDA